MKKQEKIQEAYGEYWKIVKDYVDSNGWCNVRRKIGFLEIIKKINWQTKIGNQYSWRPKSLQGIENNNGWIKIESENDLPKEKGDYFVCVDGVQPNNNIMHLQQLISLAYDDLISHYQPIKKPQPPIY